MTAVIDDLELMLAITMDAAPEPPWRQIIDADVEELRASGSLRGTFLDDSSDNGQLSSDLRWPGVGCCLNCWAPLGRHRRSYCSARCRREYARETRQTDNEAYGRMVVRVVRGYGRRVAQNDLAGLGDLADVMAEAEAAMQAAVNGLRERDVSWTEIGRELGITKQGARQRWGRPA